MITRTLSELQRLLEADAVLSLRFPCGTRFESGQIIGLGAGTDANRDITVRLPSGRKEVISTANWEITDGLETRREVTVPKGLAIFDRELLHPDWKQTAVSRPHLIVVGDPAVAA